MRPALLLIALASSAAHAQQEDHAQHSESALAGDAQIVVTINPEARVSAVIGAPMPSLVKCGETTELKVQIINQSFVTAPLRAAIVDNGKSRVALHMNAGKLSGRTQEARLLHLILLSTAPTDVTIAFSIDNNIGDLGGRDLVHLLIRCF